jgi:hypothetical protein
MDSSPTETLRQDLATPQSPDSSPHDASGARTNDASDSKDIAWCKELLKLRGLASLNQRKHDMCATADETSIQRWNHGIVAASLSSAAISGGGVVATFVRESPARPARIAAVASIMLSLLVTYGSLMKVTPEKLRHVTERRKVAAQYAEVYNGVSSLKLRVTQQHVEDTERLAALSALREEKAGADAAGAILPNVGNWWVEAKMAVTPPPKGVDPYATSRKDWDDAIRDETLKEAGVLAKQLA